MPSHSSIVKIQIVGGKGVKAKIAGHCQQSFCFQKFVENAQQCFAFTPQANFPPIIWLFTDVEGDRTESRLPFKIFSTLPSQRRKEMIPT